MDAASLRILVLAMLLAVGCGRTAPALNGAVFAVPAYPGAEVRDTLSAGTTDRHGQPVTDTQTWWLRFTDPPEKVVAFYDAGLPGARKFPSSEVPGTVARYEWKPSGASAEESVTVIISAQDIQISEIARPGKRTGATSWAGK